MQASPSARGSSQPVLVHMPPPKGSQPHAAHAVAGSWSLHATKAPPRQRSAVAPVPESSPSRQAGAQKPSGRHRGRPASAEHPDASTHSSVQKDLPSRWPH